MGQVITLEGGEAGGTIYISARACRTRHCASQSSGISPERQNTFEKVERQGEMQQNEQKFETAH